LPKRYQAPNQVRFVAAGNDYHQAEIAAGRSRYLRITKPKALPVLIRETTRSLFQRRAFSALLQADANAKFGKGLILCRCDQGGAGPGRLRLDGAGILKLTPEPKR
jgi:hypothetical protein